jgi:hypothetical protein
MRRLWTEIKVGLVVGAAVGLAVVALFALLPVFGYHAPGGRSTTWVLGDGTRVRFFKREHVPPGRDTVKVLEVTRPGAPPREYTFAEWHTAYQWVELRSDSTESVIWIVDTKYKTVGCSLELTTGSFRDEGQGHPPGVGVGTGRVVRKK